MTIDERTFRYCVEASSKPNPSTCESEKYYATWAEALSACGRGGYRYKWVSLYGRYLDSHGVPREDWIYIHWTPNEVHGDPPEIGFGHPYNDFDGPRVRYDHLERPL